MLARATLTSWERIMKIDIAKFGLKDVPVNPDAVFTFPQGLLGFENCKRFTLFHEEGKPTVFWLQSLDDENISFSVVEPGMIDICYEIELSEADCTLLDMKDTSEIVIVVILYRKEADGGKIAANTFSPLVLNTRARLGMQKVLREFHPRLLYRAR